eukprot:m.172474 g.172474  ORF g.172474 m.172474 type:complete len:81 (-) comp53268_c0_seq34:1451-1693(-)
MQYHRDIVTNDSISNVVQSHHHPPQPCRSSLELDATKLQVHDQLQSQPMLQRRCSGDKLPLVVLSLLDVVVCWMFVLLDA